MEGWARPSDKSARKSRRRTRSSWRRRSPEGTSTSGNEVHLRWRGGGGDGAGGGGTHPTPPLIVRGRWGAGACDQAQGAPLKRCAAGAPSHTWMHMHPGRRASHGVGRSQPLPTGRRDVQGRPEGQKRGQTPSVTPTEYSARSYPPTAVGYPPHNRRRVPPHNRRRVPPHNRRRVPPHNRRRVPPNNRRRVPPNRAPSTIAVPLEGATVWPQPDGPVGRAARTRPAPHTLFVLRGHGQHELVNVGAPAFLWKFAAQRRSTVETCTTKARPSGPLPPHQRIGPCAEAKPLGRRDVQREAPLHKAGSGGSFAQNGRDLGGGVGTRPRYLIVCLWRRPLASHHCSF